MVRDGTGMNDRVTMVPNSLVAPLQEHRHEEGLAKGYGAGSLPYALEHTYPYANREWTWPDVFLSDRLSVTSHSGVVRRHHPGERGLQKAIRQVAQWVMRTGTAWADMPSRYPLGSTHHRYLQA